MWIPPHRECYTEVERHHHVSSGLYNVFCVCFPSLVAESYLLKDLFDTDTAVTTKEKISKCANALARLRQAKKFRPKYWGEVCRRKWKKDSEIVLSLGADQFNTPGLYLDTILMELLLKKVKTFSISPMKSTIREWIRQGVSSAGSDKNELHETLNILLSLVLRMRFEYRGTLNPIEDKTTSVIFDIPSRGCTKEFKKSSTRTKVMNLYKELYSLTRKGFSKAKKMPPSASLERPQVVYDTSLQSGPQRLDPSEFQLADNLCAEVLKQNIDDMFNIDNPLERRFIVSLFVREISKMNQGDSPVCYIRKFTNKFFALIDTTIIRREILYRLMCEPPNRRQQYISKMIILEDTHKERYFYDPLWIFELFGTEPSRAFSSTLTQLVKPQSEAAQCLLREYLKLTNEAIISFDPGRPVVLNFFKNTAKPSDDIIAPIQWVSESVLRQCLLQFGQINHCISSFKN